MVGDRRIKFLRQVFQATTADVGVGKAQHPKQEGGRGLVKHRMLS